MVMILAKRRGHLVGVTVVFLLSFFSVVYWWCEYPRSFPTLVRPELGHIEAAENGSSLYSPPSTKVTPKPGRPTDASSIAIVAAVQSNTDLTWLSELTNTDTASPSFKLHRYNYDHANSTMPNSIPINKGHEAMAYLTYIINNYSTLPAYSIFIHGHRDSWHQESDLVSLLTHLRFPALQSVGYVPLRCDWYPSCPSEIRPIDHDAIVWGPGVHREDAEREIAQAWGTLFAGEEGTKLPRTIASQCCAQFAVTRRAIRGRERSEYVRLRDWLMETQLEDDVSGRVLEKLWAYLFTKEAVRCPPPQTCACEYFGYCEPREWPVPPKGLRKWG